ncbi:MAG: ABC transporter permease [Dongiaceae bacterium]
MLKLLSQRLALGLVTLIVVSGLIFWATELLPGDLPTNILGQQATPEDVAAIRAELGLDRPVPQRYVAWVKDALKGDFGQSVVSKRPVMAVLGPRLWNTLFLVIYAAVVAVPFSILLGILAAVGRNGLYDKVVNIAALAAISMPKFLIGFLLLLYLAVHFRWFPVITTFKPDQTLLQHLKDIFLPMATLVVVVAAHMIRMARSALLAVMASPYIEMAKFKGLSNWRIVTHHALPNALAPIVRIVALNLGYLIAGAIVVEVVFTYNGFGRLMVDAVARHDVPVVQACGLVFAVVFIGLHLVADLLCMLSDASLRHGQ